MSSQQAVIKSNSQYFKKLKSNITTSEQLSTPLAYEMPVFPASSNTSIVKQAQQQALMDWQRCMQHYFIGDSSISELRQGKTFSSIDELENFIKQHLLIGLPNSQHSTMLKQGILHLHQGGLLHAAGIALSKYFLKGTEYPVPLFDFNIRLFPLKTGIGIEETLKLKAICLPDSTVLTPANNPELKLDLTHYSTLEMANQTSDILAQSINTKLSYSPEVQRLLAIDSNTDIFAQNKSPTNTSLSLLNYLLWPATLVSQQLGFNSSLSKTHLQQEQQWLTELESTFSQTSHRLEQYQQDLRIQQKKQLQLAQQLSQSLIGIKNHEAQLNALHQQQQYGKKQLRALFSGIKQVEADIIKATPKTTNYITVLNKFIDGLRQLKHSIENKIFFVSEDSSLLTKLTTYHAQVEQQLQKAERILKYVHAPEVIAKDRQRVIQQLYIESTTFDAQIKQYQQQLQQHTKQHQQKVVQLTHQQAHTNEQLTKLDYYNQSNHTHTVTLNQLKNKLAMLSSNDDYMAYLQQRCQLIASCNKTIELETELEQLQLLPSNIDDLSTTNTKLANQLNNFNQLIQLQLNHYQEISQFLNDPTSLITPVNFEPELLKAYKQTEQSTFKKLKQNALTQLKSYSDPKSYFALAPSWFGSGQWGKQNAVRARNFTTLIKNCKNISQLFFQLYSEYQVASQHVKNPSGAYCLGLAKLLTEMKKYISPQLQENILQQADHPPSHVLIL